MSHQFSRFQYTSPLSSISHSPQTSLASNCIREFFGPYVQLVADCLESRGEESTLAQIISTINNKTNQKSRTEERKKLFQAAASKHNATTATISADMAAAGGAVNVPTVRAALLALIQHSIVVVRSSVVGKKKKTTKYTYEFDPKRARLLSRYPRFVDYTKKAVDETASAFVEELLLNGRMRTVDAIVATVERLNQMEDEGQRSTDHRYTTRKLVLEGFRRLVHGGFLQEIGHIEVEGEEDDEDHTFDGPPPAKKRRIEPREHDSDDPAVVDLLQSGTYKILPRDAVWRVNMKMFHDSMRAVSLGILIKERYDQQDRYDRVQFAGSFITAALRLAAHKEHGLKIREYESQTTFTPGTMMSYLPKEIRQRLEKKPGGALANLHRALLELSNYNNPTVLEEVEVGDGQPGNAKFRVMTRKLIQYLQNRIVHQIILDSHGETAARVCSILRVNRYLEADAIAKSAMVPVKDTREVLHTLYRNNYIDLFNINQGRQHNPQTMIYLWTVSRARTMGRVTDNVCTALLNMRLRRQHEVEVGREWIERAKEAGATDENENEADKLNYTRFCQGLDRLEKAALQLDETLMVLKDY